MTLDLSSCGGELVQFQSSSQRGKVHLCIFQQEPFLWKSHLNFLAFGTNIISMNKYMCFQYTNKLRHHIVYVLSMVMSSLQIRAILNGYDISSTALIQSKLLKYFYYLIIIAPNSCNWNIYYTFQLLQCKAIIKPKLKHNAGPNEDFLVNNSILMWDEKDSIKFNIKKQIPVPILALHFRTLPK